MANKKQHSLLEADNTNNGIPRKGIGIMTIASFPQTLSMMAGLETMGAISALNGLHPSMQMYQVMDTLQNNPVGMLRRITFSPSEGTMAALFRLHCDANGIARHLERAHGPQQQPDAPHDSPDHFLLANTSKAFKDGAEPTEEDIVCAYFEPLIGGLQRCLNEESLSSTSYDSWKHAFESILLGESSSESVLPEAEWFWNASEAATEEPLTTQGVLDSINETLDATTARENVLYRVGLLAKTARDLAHEGRRDAAIAVFREAIDAARSASKSPAVPALLVVRSLRPKDIETVETKNDDYSLAFLLTEIAVALIKVGFEDWAEEVVDEALAAARRLEPEKASDLSRELACSLTTDRFRGHVREILLEAAETAKQISYMPSRCSQLQDIAKALADAGFPDEAQRVCAESISSAQAIENVRKRMYGLIDGMMSQEGHVNLARMFFDEIVTTARGIREVTGFASFFLKTVRTVLQRVVPLEYSRGLFQDMFLKGERASILAYCADRLRNSGLDDWTEEISALLPPKTLLP